MKSPAHIKDFFDRIDKGLAISTAFSGKMEEFIEVRRMLRDESASAAPPAARRDPRAEARSSSSMVDDEIGDDDAFGGDDESEISESGARFRHDAKASMSCKTCRSLGRGCWSLRKRGNQHSEISQTWVCTNPVCAHYSHLPSKIQKRKEGKRASRKCKSCAETGKGEFFCDSDRKVVDLKVELLESKLRNNNQER
jgi:hypothetical protein